MREAGMSPSNPRPARWTFPGGARPYRVNRAPPRRNFRLRKGPNTFAYRGFLDTGWTPGCCG